jgi:hypothetical protein
MGKRCRKCGVDKATDAFGVNRRNKDGLMSMCYECERASSAARRTANPEAVKAYSRKYREANREVCNARSNDRRLANLERALQAYGGRCAQCGSTDRLEFDHVYGDGFEHRERESNNSLITRIARLGRPIAEYELQLLCRQHHREKTAADRRAAHAMYAEARKWDRVMAQLEDSPFAVTYDQCFAPGGVGSNAPTSSSSNPALTPR